MSPSTACSACCRPHPVVARWLRAVLHPVTRTTTGRQMSASLTARPAHQPPLWKVLNSGTWLVTARFNPAGGYMEILKAFWRKTALATLLATLLALLAQSLPLRISIYFVPVQKISNPPMYSLYWIIPPTGTATPAESPNSRSSTRHCLNFSTV